MAENLGTWQEMWDDGKIGFHRAKVHERLITHIDQLTGGKKNCRIFVPLCGKTNDMVWLWQLGHEVVGVEAVEVAVQDFFREQDLKHTEAPVDGLADARLYQNEDGRIKIYRADLFALDRNILGSFDAVWDRGSMVAINPCDRARYSVLMKSLVGAGGRILLEGYSADCDNGKYTLKDRAPFALPEAEVKTLYEPEAEVQLLETWDVLEEEFRKAGLTWMNGIMFVLTFSP